MSAGSAARRIRAGADFKRCQQGGRRVHTAHFVWLLYARGDAAPARLGLAISRRVGNAVRRNRVKRLLRQAFAARTWPLGLDLVVIGKAPPTTLTLSDVLTELAQATPTFERRLQQAQADAAKRGPVSHPAAALGATLEPAQAGAIKRGRTLGSNR